MTGRTAERAATAGILLLLAGTLMSLSLLGLRRRELAERWVPVVFLLWSTLVYPLATGRPVPPGLAGLFLPAPVW